jgi:deazaflavin-dependent oxidoreductase (nitroreductase family)
VVGDFDDPTDSPVGWVRDHIRKYVESDGRRGHRWSGTDTLLLTTRGRRSGQPRRTALIYGRDGDRYVVVASKGGSPKHPLWYLNLVADPHVRVQVGPERLDGVARTAQGDERERLWAVMREIWPEYDTYQRRTSREIPVIVIEPTRRGETEAPPR